MFDDAAVPMLAVLVTDWLRCERCNGNDATDAEAVLQISRRLPFW